MDETQASMDRFYCSNGPCCAGCDWWQSANGRTGLCTKSAPVSGKERTAMLEMHSCSLPIGAGHVFTKRNHKCGDFKDDFDWQSLSPAYLKSIGYQHEKGKQ